MASWKIKELEKELTETYIPKFGKVENRLMIYTKASMVDPELVEEAVSQLRGISQYIEHINKAFYLCLHERKEFYSTYNSTLSLRKNLTDLIEKLKAEDTDNSEAIKQYLQILASGADVFEVLSWSKAFLELPKAKKRYKIWKQRNLGVINKEFQPFVELYKRILALDNFLEENF